MGKKILIPEDITEPGKEFLRDKGYEVIVLNNPTETDICAAIKDCQGYISRSIKCSRQIMEAAPQLKVISSHGVGTEQIDVDTATELNIQVTNAPLANTNSAAEHTIALLLGCANNLVYQDQQTRLGNFASRNTVKSMEVAGKTLGIVGCGRIGQAVARKAVMGLGMNAMGFDAFIPADRWPQAIARCHSLEELVKKADVISLHVPATKDTINMFDAKMFALMKKNAILLNCARGKVINEKDLYTALKQGEIAAAGLDVFAEEPAVASNPLFQLANIIVSPHNAGLSKNAMDKMGLAAAQGIDEVLTGQSPTWPVNKI